MKTTVFIRLYFSKKIEIANPGLHTDPGCFSQRHAQPQRQGREMERKTASPGSGKKALLEANKEQPNFIIAKTLKICQVSNAT